MYQSTALPMEHTIACLNKWITYLDEYKCSKLNDNKNELVSLGDKTSEECHEYWRNVWQITEKQTNDNHLWKFSLRIMHKIRNTRSCPFKDKNAVVQVHVISKQQISPHGNTDVWMGTASTCSELCCKIGHCLKKCPSF